MRRRDASASIPRTDLLKIDKDCVVNAKLQREYVGTILDICGKHGFRVLWIKRTDTAHGVHFYIKISPAVGAMTANDLHYLLGDDSKRVGFNKARIESGLVEWSKLFERASCRMTTIYRAV
jgi:hypothetical protein